jgi:hypothetical protein
MPRLVIFESHFATLSCSNAQGSRLLRVCGRMVERQFLIKLFHPQASQGEFL